ncbi:hypothetical protein [Nocardioides mesophilus]|uniref:TOMM leader peptide-binding protein n=1 Tax=Nocardioides mesophilus TaxID=433659 RepID=A0A7G9R852_9ACTN|nr:hypothetical protein [Nocardioides mesophilus]QNN51777.1 hypothetical protein H9L09_14650 [Nocardioides mesophilus]
MRPLLRPGTHVLQRGDGRLQLGLDPASAVILPDEPEVRELLAGLDGSTRDDDLPLLTVLREQSLVLDEHDVLPLLNASNRCPAPAAAALARQRGAAAGPAADRRAATRLEVRGFGGDELADQVVALAGRLGLRAGAPSRKRASGDDAVVGVLAGIGEPDRELADPWVRESTPYVVVRMCEGHAVVGPFVAPGRTSCLRCIDAHHTDADPAWPLLVQQYSRLSSRPRRDGVPEPVDPVLATLAAAWAVRDLASYVDGVRPSTWSTTLVLDAELAEVESRCWLRHPECGCGWA